MAIYQVNPNINASVILSGSVANDAQFAEQPVVNEHIIYPKNLTVDAQLNISGPSGTHKLWHVKLNGSTIATNYIVTPGDVAVGSASYQMPSEYTVAKLQSGFDPYVFEGWSPQPVINEQLITETQYGYFDNLGNYYSNVENIHDAWFVGLDGTTTYFTIDNRLNVTSNNITPDPFTITAKINVPRNSTVTFDSFNVLGMDAGLDSPINVTNGTWSKSSDNGNTWSAHTSAPGTVRNGDKVEIEHQSDPLGLVNTTTLVDINGVTANAVSTTAADLTPNTIIGGSKADVPLSSVVEFNPFQVTGMTPGQDSPISVVGGRYSISTDGGNTYSAPTSSAGNVQNGQWVRPEHDSSGEDGDTRVTTITIETVSANFVSTTISTDVVVVGSGGNVITPDVRKVSIGKELPSSYRTWPPMDLNDRIDYAWNLSAWLGTDTIAAAVTIEGASIIDDIIFSDTEVLVWINPNKPGSNVNYDDSVKVTVLVTTASGRELEISAGFAIMDR